MVGPPCGPQADKDEFLKKVLIHNKVTDPAPRHKEASLSVILITKPKSYFLVPSVSQSLTNV